ncbi:MAG: tetratricopeptide repeat protein [Candidatus Aminicenantes bacterium]|nr:tetratricopeptide repeat protein [Candidatus Aminicenantes bacterium]
MKKNIICLVWIFMLLACGGSKARTVPGQLQPDSAEYLANMGVGYLNSGQWQQAENSLLKALQKKPQLVTAMHALSLVYVYRRDFVKAVDMLNRLVLTSPKFYDAYNLLGTIYTEQGHYQLAKEKLLLAANAEEYLTPENAFANLAVLEIKYEKYTSALRYAEKGLLFNRKFAPLYNLKGLALENMNEYVQALENYDKALSLLPRPDSIYLINSARVATKLGDKQKALNNLELAMGNAQSQEQKTEIMKMIRQLDGG